MLSTNVKVKCGSMSVTLCWAGTKTVHWAAGGNLRVQQKTLPKTTRVKSYIGGHQALTCLLHVYLILIFFKKHCIELDC